MCCRTLQNLHCREIRLPKHGSLQREAFLRVPDSLVHEIKWKGRRMKEILLSLSPKLHLLILDLCGGDDWCCLCCFPFVWSRPRLVLSWMFSLRFLIEVHLAAYPKPNNLSGVGQCLRREPGAFWSLLARSSFLLSLLVFFGRGSDTVMHSVLLPGASRSSSKVRLCREYKVTWTSSCLHTHSFLFQLATYKYEVQLMELYTGDEVLVLFL